MKKSLKFDFLLKVRLEGAEIELTAHYFSPYVRKRSSKFVFIIRLRNKSCMCTFMLTMIFI